MYIYIYEYICVYEVIMQLCNTCSCTFFFIGHFQWDLLAMIKEGILVYNPMARQQIKCLVFRVFSSQALPLTLENAFNVN